MDKKSKIILLNGGKGCGKSVVADVLYDLYYVEKAHCKQHLWDLTCKFFNVTEEVFFDVYHNRFTKELLSTLFTINKNYWHILCDSINYQGTDRIRYVDCNNKVMLSSREALIFVSEVIMKPVMGNDYFGQVRADNIVLDGTLYLDDSAGFQEELPPLIDKIGAENVLLIRIRGRGDFEGDSRSFITTGNSGCTEVDVMNTGTEDEFYAKVQEIVSCWANV